MQSLYIKIVGFYYTRVEIPRSCPGRDPGESYG